MIKKIMGFVLALLLVQIGFSQKLPDAVKPDFVKIEKEIKDKNSPLFYATLMKRYKNNDSTLTLEDYRHLYYGYTFQDDYSAYGKPKVNDDLKKAKNAGDLEEVIDLQKKALEEFPFNLRNLYGLSDALYTKGDTIRASIYDKKMNAVAKAILSTGNGNSDSTSMYVISVDHEYDLISLFGFEFGGGQSLVSGKDGQMDKMKLKKNDAGIEYLYFNVNLLFKSMEKMFKKN